MIIFSSKECAAERQIADILISCGAALISESRIVSGTAFTAAVTRQITDIKADKGAVLFLDADNFRNQRLPEGFIGICEDCNTPALRLLAQNRLPVISCGMNSRNTVTLSSLAGTVLATVQRSLTDINGNTVTPGEYKIRLKKSYSPFAVTAAASVLLFHGIIPEEF